MYRDGNFQSLRWNMLEASHKAHWEKLSSVYGLEEPEKLLKSEAQKKDMPVLDQLAELCICSCQNYLFSLTPVKDVIETIPQNPFIFNGTVYEITSSEFRESIAARYSCILPVGAYE